MPEWFETEWSEVEGYHDPMDDCPWDLPDLITKPKLGERQWTPERIRARGEELCAVDPDALAGRGLAALYQHLADVDEALTHIKDDWPSKQIKIHDSTFWATVVPPKVDRVYTYDKGYNELFGYAPSDSDTDDEDAASGSDAEDAAGAQDNKEDKHVKHHVDLAKQLLRRHEHVRAVTLERTRPLVRPLGLHDLPPEIIVRVVSLCDTGGHHRSEREVQLIRALRLTCRTLHDLASPLLIRGVTVRITPASLAHLDCVSRHPLLGRGVRSVRLALGYFDPAMTPILFVSYALAKIQAVMFQEDESGRPYLSCFSPEEAKRVTTMVAFGMRLLEPRHRDDAAGGFTAHAQPLFDRSALGEAFRVYERRRADYEEALGDGAFVRGLADALARMPAAAGLELSASDRLWEPSWALKHVSGGAISSRESIVDLVAGPMEWEAFSFSHSRRAFENPSVVALSQLLPALGGRGVRLSKLDVAMTPPAYFEDLAADGEDALRLAAEAVRDLSRFRLAIRPQPAPKDHRTQTMPRRWQARDDDELAGLDEFLGVALGSAALDHLLLDFESLRAENTDEDGRVTGDWYLPALMRPGRWPLIQSMHLKNVCLDSGALDGFLGERPLVVYELREAHMARGTWAEALDVMRRKVDPAQPRRPHGGWKPGDLRTFEFGQFSHATGAECDDMDRDLWWHVWSVGKRNRKDPDDEFRASRYVNHKRDENPFHEDVGLGA